MTANPELQAKMGFETLVKLEQVYTYSQLLAILTVANMQDKDLKGAIRKVVKPMKGHKKNASVYSATDVLKLFLANKLAQETRERISQSGKNNRFVWDLVRTSFIPGMIMNKKDELFYGDPIGQQVILEMVKTASGSTENR